MIKAIEDRMNSLRPKGVIVAGPTASGKSDFAALLARAVGGAVVNADSMQVYRDLPIITAIPQEEERGDIPHYGYAVLDGGERCSVGRWLGLTRSYIKAILEKRAVPILCGGTGMYIRAAMEGISPVPDIAPDIRDEATAMHQQLGGGKFRQALAEYDPVLAGRLHDGDTQRLIRGMEVALATGQPLSELQDAAPEGGLDLDWVVVRLSPPRADLYAMIDRRYPKMIESGALDEARRFAGRGLDANLPLMKAVGLPPLLAHLKGELDLEAAIALSCRDSRRYAKRQTTWFNNQLQDNFRQDLGYNAQLSKSFIERILSNIAKKG
jgi:tRNA dimethylallyltransferase